MGTGGDFSCRASAPWGSGLATVPEQHGDEVGHLATYAPRAPPKPPTQKANHGRGRSCGGGPAPRSGAQPNPPPRRRRRRPALSRVLNLPLPRLPPLPRLGGGRAARRAPSGLQAAGQHDLPLPCECQCPGEGKPPGKSMSPEQERTEITAIRALPSLFSSNDFCPFPFRAPFLQQGPALPETSFPFLAYDHSLDVKETERHWSPHSVKKALPTVMALAWEGQSHRCCCKGRTGLWCRWCQGKVLARWSWDLRGKLPFLHIRRACCCLAAESSPRSVRRGELGWKLDNVPRRVEKIERLIPAPHPHLVFLLPGGKESFCKSLPFWSRHKAHNWDVKYTLVLNYNCQGPDGTCGGIIGLTIRIKWYCHTPQQGKRKKVSVSVPRWFFTCPETKSKTPGTTTGLWIQLLVTPPGRAVISQSGEWMWLP